MKLSKLTRVQRRMFHLLSDGRRHAVKELIECTSDPEMNGRQNVEPHISGLRKLLRAEGADIVFENTGRGFYYRLVIIYRRGALD